MNNVNTQISKESLNISLNKLVLFIGFLISLFAFIGSIVNYLSAEVRIENTLNDKKYVETEFFG